MDERIVALLRGRLPDLQAVWLFGSRARGDAVADSDLDLGLMGACVLDPLALLDLSAEIARLVCHDVDLVDLRLASDLLVVEVMREGRLLWAVDVAEAESFLLHAWSDLLDFREGEALRDKEFSRPQDGGGRRAG